MMFTLGILAWYVGGMISFVYWYTRDCDIKMSDLPGVLLIGCGGPLNIIIGYLIHGTPSKNDKVLFKRRGK